MLNSGSTRRPNPLRAEAAAAQSLVATDRAPTVGLPPAGRPLADGLVEHFLLGLMLVGLAIGCLLVLLPFFSAILGAGILVFTTWPLYEWLRLRMRLRRGGAATVMVALAALVFVLPLALAAPGNSGNAGHLRIVIEEAVAAGLPPAPGWVGHIPLFGGRIASIWNFWAADLSAMADAFRPYFGLAAEALLSVLLGVANGVVLFMLALFIAFFFYVYGEPLAAGLRAILRRVTPEQADRLIAVTGATIRGTVFGILGTALFQGLLTALGLWAAGVPHPVLLAAIAGFLSILPIGAPLVWGPASVWLLADGDTAAGLFLIGYGLIVITGTYHIVQPWLISRGAQLPFLLTVLGVLGGALAFGLLGIFVGPALLGTGFTLATEWSRGGERKPGTVPAP